MSKRKRIAVLISGRGSNMISIVEACKRGDIKGDVVLVLSNKKKAAGLERAADFGIETCFLSHRKFDSREMYDAAIVEELKSHRIDLVVLAGFMRLLSPVLVKAFPNRIMNIHPSLLPSFPGVDAQWQAFDYGVKVSGATVHFVDEELDHGPIILQQEVRIDDVVDGAGAAAKIIEVEHQIYPKAIALYCEDKLQITGRRVGLAK